MTLEQYILIGKMGKPFGLKGEFVFHLYSDKLDDIYHFNQLFTKKEDSFFPIPDISFKIQGKKIIAKIKNINNLDNVHKIINQEVYILKQDLPGLDENEYYYVDLIGCSAYYLDNKFGLIRNVVNYGATDLFEIEDESGKTVMIPFLNDRIIKINIDKKEIYFKDLEGFL